MAGEVRLKQKYKLYHKIVMYSKHIGIHITRHMYLCLVSPVAIKRSRMMSSSVNTSLVRKRSTSIFICPWKAEMAQCMATAMQGATLQQRHTLTTYVCTHALYLVQNWYYLALSLPIHSLKGKQTKTAALLGLRTGTALLVTDQAAQRIHCTHSTQHTDEYIGQHCHIYKHTTTHCSSHHALTCVLSCRLRHSTMCTASHPL